MKTYFSKFPLIEYWFSSESNKFVVVDFFRRVKFFDSLESTDGLFDYTTVSEDDRPDVMAFKLYGNSDLHWIIHMVNYNLDPKNWVMNYNVLNNFIEQKYDNPDVVYYTERDGIPASVQSATIRHTKNPFKTIDSNPPNTPATDMDATKYWGVTYREFETRRNDTLRVIRFIKPEFIDSFLAQMERKLMEL